VTLHLPDRTVQMEFNGTWKYVSRVYPLSQLLTVTVDFTGTNPTNLVISHGCTGVKLDGKIATTILDESGTAVPGTPPAAALGSKVKDSVTFTPAPGGSASDMTTGATVTYHFYTGACGDNSAEVGTGQTVPAGDNSSLTAALAAGSYHYTASYNGNDAYNAIAATNCEPLTINKAQLKITTQIHGVILGFPHSDVGGATHVALGSTVHDTATITGQVAGFTAPGANDVAFTRDGFAVLSDNGNVDAIRSVESAPLAAGSYTYKASVAGNDNYLAATSGDEPLTVDKAQLGITTTIHNAAHGAVTSVSPGSIVHDTATLSGVVAGFDPAAVSFTLNGAGVATDPSTTPDAIRSVDSAPLAAGSYTYKASVADNANYIGATSADEPLSVLQFGKTQGFWGNQNGVAKIIAGGGYLANAVNIGRGANIDTQAEAAKVLPNSLNACGKGTPSIFTVGAATATANCTLATGVNINSLNTLAAQTLALGYNIKLVAGYAGQTIAGLGSTAFLTAGLTGTSTVQDAFNAAVALINGSAAGGTTTQAQIGAMNALLGSLNREA